MFHYIRTYEFRPHRNFKRAHYLARSVLLDAGNDIRVIIGVRQDKKVLMPTICDNVSTYRQRCHEAEEDVKWIYWWVGPKVVVATGDSR